MTDHYDLVVTAFHAMLGESLPEYFPRPDKQFSKADDTILDNGHDYYVTAYPGAFPIEPMGTGVYEVDWEVQVELYVRWKKSEKQAWIDFSAFRADIFNLVNVTMKGRTLDRTNGVRDAVLSSADRPSYIPVNSAALDGAVAFIRQICLLNVPYKINRS